MLTSGLKMDGHRARMKAEGPVGRQYNPGDRQWRLVRVAVMEVVRGC